MGRIRFSLIALVAVLLAGGVLAVSAPAAGGELQVGMALADGRVLVYRGAAAGLKQGDAFTVVREGEVIGFVKLVDVRETYSIGVILEQKYPVAANDELRTSAAVVEPEPKFKYEMKLKPVVKSEPELEAEPDIEKSVMRREVRKKAAKKIEKQKGEKENEKTVEKKKKKVTKKEKDEEPDEAVAEEEEEEKEEKKEKKKKPGKKKEKKKRSEEVAEDKAGEKEKKKKKAKAKKAEVPSRLLYYDRYRVRVGYIRPRGNHYDPVFAADIDREPAAIFGIDWVTVERPNLAMIGRFQYGEPRIDSGPGDYSGRTRYMQIAFNFIKSHRAYYFDDHYHFYGLGVGYQRMGAGLRCISQAGCGNGVNYGGYSSSREDTVGLNLIYGYHFSEMNLEVDYVVNDGDFYLTFDYPLGSKEVYRLVEKDR